MSSQMMRVISSPSSSTTGFLTLILEAVAIVRIMPATLSAGAACVTGESLKLGRAEANAVRRRVAAAAAGRMTGDLEGGGPVLEKGCREQGVRRRWR